MTTRWQHHWYIAWAFARWIKITITTYLLPSVMIIIILTNSVWRKFTNNSPDDCPQYVGARTRTKPIKKWTGHFGFSPFQKCPKIVQLYVQVISYLRRGRLISSQSHKKRIVYVQVGGLAFFTRSCLTPRFGGALKTIINTTRFFIPCEFMRRFQSVGGGWDNIHYTFLFLVNLREVFGFGGWKNL